jgi:hypothetical protein
MGNDVSTKIPAADKDDAVKQFWGAIKTFFEDLATLDVVTMTGTIGLKVEEISGFKNIIQKLSQTDSVLHTVAVSHHEIDFDAALFVKDNLSDNEKELLKMHLETVKAAQEMRNKVVEMATNALNLLK